MIREQVRDQFQSTKLALRDRIFPPPISKLAQDEEAFVSQRDALLCTRTVYTDVQNTIAEVYEAANELWHKGERPTRRQRLNLAEETADVAIYTMSALLAFGVGPTRIDKQVSKLLDTNKTSQQSAPLLERLQHVPPTDIFEELHVAASDAHEILTNGKNPMDTQEFYDGLIETSLFWVLQKAFEVGHRVSPHFEAIIAGKLRKNEKRFPKRRFVVKEGEDPEVIKAVGYAASKVNERRWELDDTPRRLLSYGIVAFRELGEEEIRTMVQAAV